MAEPADHPLIHRIDAAIARIEAAAGSRAYAADTLARRHTVLRERMGEAIEAIDALLARGGHKPERE